MFRKISNNQKTEAKDESVRQEARQAEELNSIQPMGNEAANAELMDQMLNEINTGRGASEKSNLISNEIGSSSDDEDSDHIISTSSKKKEKKSKKKPDQKDAENALEIAEDILKDAPAKKVPEFKAEFDPLSTYAEDGDLAAVRGGTRAESNRVKNPQKMRPFLSRPSGTTWEELRTPAGRTQP